MAPGTIQGWGPLAPSPFPALGEGGGNQLCTGASQAGIRGCRWLWILWLEACEYDLRWALQSEGRQMLLCHTVTDPRKRLSPGESRT